MKKLSMIIALALVLTIGGVFAAWHYSTGKIDKLEIGPGLQMATVETHSETAEGIIDQVSAHTFSFRVDDKHDYLTNDGNTETNPTDDDKYVAILLATGSWQVKFTPHENSSDEIRDGVPLLVTVTVEGNTEYDGQVILTPKANSNSFVIDETLETITITADQILGCLDFVDNVVLDTPEKNSAFADALADYVVKITITQHA